MSKLREGHILVSGKITVFDNAEILVTAKGAEIGEVYQDEDDKTWGCHHYKADGGYGGMEEKCEAVDSLYEHHDEFIIDLHMRIRRAETAKALIDSF